MKYYSRLSKLLAPDFNSNKFFSASRCLKNSDSSHLLTSKNISKTFVFQNPIDEVYFGIFSAIAGDLKNSSDIKIKNINTDSINSYIGYGFWSFIKRSPFLARFRINKWLKYTQPSLGNNSFVSLTYFYTFYDFIDFFKSIYTWITIKDSYSFQNLKIANIQVGDIITDTYLRFRPAAKLDIKDTFLLRVIWQAYRDTRRLQKFFQSKPDVFFTSYTSYIFYGIPARVALSNGVEVYSFSNPNGFEKKLSNDDFLNRFKTDKYLKNFNLLKNKQKKIIDSESYILNRFSGEIDPTISYMKSSAYAGESKVFKEFEGAAIIFLHDFFDSPHVYEDFLFPDFWEWVTFTIDSLENNNIKFYIKPHPNQINGNEEIIEKLKTQYKNVNFLSSDISNMSLVKNNISCVITAYGTVGAELAYFGVPSITCASHTYHSFSFSRTARSVHEYKNFLNNPSYCALTKEEMKKESLIFNYMHNLHKSSIKMAGDFSNENINTLVMDLFKHVRENKEVDFRNKLISMRKNQQYIEFINRLT